MNLSDQEIIDRVLAHDHRAVARAITLSENNVPRSRKIQAALFKKAGKARVVGVTGSPGAGKSTLVDQLADIWLGQGKKVAILAVDPTSPFSGGAILGDRIRMNKSVEHAGLYIRSMATRGALGGISRATWDAVQILDAAGFDIILIETVGVGQAEVDIVRTAWATVFKCLRQEF
jgi:LAO/AO transport system kinase